MNFKQVLMLSAALSVGATLSVNAQGGRGGVVSVRPLVSSVAKGMPYSAETVTESTQVLGDGNRIVSRTTGRVYRDSEGRLRREEDRASGTPSITITDPVVGVSYTLNPANHTATESASAGVVTLRSAVAVREPAGVMVAAPRGTGAAAGRVGAAGTPGTTGTLAASRSGGAGGFIVRRDEVVEEPLANRMMEGVLASGIRRTTTIAKGAIGNEQPIKIVSEEWTSVDLQLLVMTDVNDPRTGHSTYRLLNINRSEPNPALFKVPADYTVTSTGSGRGRGGQQ